MKFLDIRSNMFKKHSDKKGNFVEESFAAELNVIWIPAHFWNTDSETNSFHCFIMLSCIIILTLYYYVIWIPAHFGKTDSKKLCYHRCMCKGCTTSIAHR